MRIIGGKFRSRKLVTLEGLKTRPTLDGTKEAIFNSLGNYIPDFVVLDVFGGSGALSLESISRGAKHAYIIDNNVEAIKIIKTNIARLCKSAVKIKFAVPLFFVAHKFYAVDIFRTGAKIGEIFADRAVFQRRRGGYDFKNTARVILRHRAVYKLRSAVFYIFFNVILVKIGP